MAIFLITEKPLQKPSDREFSHAAYLFLLQGLLHRCEIIKGVQRRLSFFFWLT